MQVNKRFVAPAVLGLLFIATVSAVVFFSQVQVDATVSEALSSTTLNIDVSGFPGETITQNISVQNDASVPLDVSLAWSEVSNLNTVDYTTDMPKVVTVQPGLNEIPVSFTYATDSPIGDISGTIDLSRQ